MASNKLRIVLDSSTLVGAALRTQSMPAQVLKYAQQHGQLFASRSTLDEIATVLAGDKFDKYLHPAERALFVKNYAQFVRLVEPKEHITDCRDAKDNQFLELALAAHADILVSSDEDLLVLHPWRGITIIKPADFIAQYAHERR